MPEFKKDYRGGRGRDFSSRGNSPRTEMHKAVCSTCGKDCMVPFIPTGSKPVLCSNCFEKSGGRDANRANFRDTQRSNSSDRPMFDAVCDKCGTNCKIPFQPRSGKPVYCSNCFDTVVNPRPNYSDQKQTPQNNDQFTQLHAKLDKILELLSPKAEEVTEEVVILTEQIVSPPKKPRVKKTPTIVE